MKEKLIVALDAFYEEDARQLIDCLGSSVGTFKVGLEQYLSSRGKILEYLRKKNKRIFLDLKFHDIPNTMQAAARAAVRENVWMFNIHVTGLEGMKKVCEAASEESKKIGTSRPLVIGVTFLTSLANDDLLDLGITLPLEELVLKRAVLAQKAGLDGVVCSPREVSDITQNCGRNFVAVCPGIRPSWSDPGDQKRIMTPAEAVSKGAHYIVVGRPITEAKEPREAAEKIIQEMGAG